MISPQIVVSEDHESANEARMPSPTLSQMLLNPKLSRTAFRYPINRRLSDEGKRQKNPASPFIAKTTPKTPASEPPNRPGNRSGTRSLGIRRRLRSVENSASPCFGQKRPAKPYAEFGCVNSKKIKPSNVLISAESQRESNTPTINESESRSSQCESKVLDDMKSSVKGLKVEHILTQYSYPTTCQQEQANSCTIKITGSNAISEAENDAELLSAKIEKGFNAPSAFERSVQADVPNKRIIPTDLEPSSACGKSIQTDVPVLDNTITPTNLEPSSACGKSVHTDVPKKRIPPSNLEPINKCEIPDNSATVPQNVDVSLQKGFRTASNKDIPVSRKAFDLAAKFLEKVWADKTSSIPSVCEKQELNFDPKMVNESSMHTSDEKANAENLPIASEASNMVKITSPVLQNRRTYKKRLKRRKIRYGESDKPCLIDAARAEPAKDDINPDIVKAADSFLNDGLDMELLAVDLNDKFSKDCVEETTENPVVHVIKSCQDDTTNELNTVSTRACSYENNSAALTACLIENTVEVNNGEIQQSGIGRACKSCNISPHVEDTCKTLTVETKRDIVHCSDPVFNCLNSSNNTTSLSCSLPTRKCANILDIPQIPSPHLSWTHGHDKPFESDEAKSKSVGDDVLSSDDELLARVGAELDKEHISNSETTLPDCSAANESSPFATASKKQIHVSNAAMTKARIFFSSLQENMNTDLYTTYAGKTPTESTLLTDHTYPTAENRQSPTNCSFTSETFGFVGFTTASRKQIQISDAAMSRAKIFFTSLQHEARDGSSLTVPPPEEIVASFQTQARDGVSLSVPPPDEIVAKSPSSIDCLWPVAGDQSFIGFRSASNKPMIISETALAKAKLLLADEGIAKEMQVVNEQTNAETSENEPLQIKGLTNVFKLGAPQKGRKRNKEFKPPRPVDLVIKEDSSKATETRLNTTSPVCAKKILGVKHIGNSQIAVSDESLVKAVEMFEDIFS